MMSVLFIVQFFGWFGFVWFGLGLVFFVWLGFFCYQLSVVPWAFTRFFQFSVNKYFSFSLCTYTWPQLIPPTDASMWLEEGWYLVSSLHCAFMEYSCKHCTYCWCLQTIILETIHSTIFPEAVNTIQYCLSSCTFR